jgi:hypothetical protein
MHLKSKSVMLILLGIGFLSPLFFSCHIHDACDPGRIELDSFNAYAGDEVVYLQWNAEEYGLTYPYLIIQRIGHGGRTTVGEYSIFWEVRGSYPDWGTCLDSTCLNGRTYGYFLESGTHPQLFFSDTIFATPEQGLPNPIPPSPESLSVTYNSDSFTISWTAPQNNDSLYYIYQKDSMGTYWYTKTVDAIRRNTAQYSSPFTLARYYRIAVFVQGILSLPSDSVEVIPPK